MPIWTEIFLLPKVNEISVLERTGKRSQVCWYSQRSKVGWRWHSSKGMSPPLGSQGESQGRKKQPAGAQSSVEQVDLIRGKAKIKALIRVLTPLLVNLRLGTCQFSILGYELIRAQGQIFNEALSLFFPVNITHTHFPAHHVHKFGG